MLRRTIPILLALSLSACAQMRAPHAANEKTFNLPETAAPTPSDPTCGWLAAKSPGKEDTLFYCCAGVTGSAPRCREALWN